MSPQALQAGEVLPLVRSLGLCPDPVDLFVALADGGLRPDTLLLESADQSTPRGEKSLLIAGSALRIRCRGREVSLRALNPNGLGLLPWLAAQLTTQAEVHSEKDRLLVRYPPPPRGDEQTRLSAPSPVDALRTVARGCRLHSGQASLGPLVAGVFSYDLLGVYEVLPPSREDPLDWPDYELWLPDRLVWLNHQQHTATAAVFVFGGEHHSRVYHDSLEALGALVRTIESLSAELPRAPGPGTRGGVEAPATTAGPAEGCSRIDPQQAALAAAQAGGEPGLDVEVDQDDAAYAAVVERLKEHIVAGDVFQIVPSRTFSTPCPRPVDAYRRLRRLNPSPYMFLVNSPAGVLFGSSPETAVKVFGSPPRVEISPIAGTRQRARRGDGSIDEDLDSRLEAELRLTEKEVAEHMMLVDLARNDVARVSKAGTRRVDRLLGVDRYSHVMHLVSCVSGELRADLDALGAYVATMNMGTLVGAPKIKAAELLRTFELCRRGPYGGAVGYFTMDGRLDTSIVIRSAVVRAGRATVRAGAGVVYDSDPVAEALETRRKADAVLQAIRQAQRGDR